MHIMTVKISQATTDMVNIAMANKYKVAYDLSIGIGTSDFGSL